MKYIIETLKYIKNNFFLLLPSLAVAMLAFAPIIDFSAGARIAEGFSDGKITAGFSDWFKLFMPFNSENWITIVLSIAAYVALVLDVAFTHSMVDKHIRFGSRNFRSILSSFTINFIYGLISMIAVAAAVLILALLMAIIMTAFSLAPAYVFIAGAAICVLLALFFVFVTAHFFLWLPCAEITGYRMSEALYSSYAQARTIRWHNFVAIALPLAVALVITTLIAVFLGNAAAIIAGAVCFGCAYMVIIVSSYMAYADVEGIEREDLRKY